MIDITLTSHHIAWRVQEMLETPGESLAVYWAVREGQGQIGWPGQ